MHAPASARRRRRTAQLMIGTGIAFTALVTYALPAMAQDEVDPVRLRPRRP